MRTLGLITLLLVVVGGPVAAQPVVGNPAVSVSGGIVTVTAVVGSTNEAHPVAVWAVLLGGGQHRDVPLDWNGRRWVADYWLASASDPAPFEVMVIAVDSDGVFAVSAKTKGQ